MPKKNLTSFVGRERELELLQERKELSIASLVVCKGRRRVGKSRLIHEFGKSFPRFYQFQGLAPDPDQKKKINQLQVFSEQFTEQFHMPGGLQFNNWSEAFSFLAEQCLEGPVLIFLDEISWLADGDPTFSGKLKIAWDTKFKENPELILVVCGSVSSWIDEHILNSTGFVGRVSLTLHIKELPLKHCNSFWRNQKDKISAFEKAKLLSITGGVPRYLEEISPKLSTEENIRNLCFRPEGLLFSEFDNIFNEQFQERATTYRLILQSLVQRKLTASEIAKKLKKTSSGYLSSCLQDLLSAGFIARDSLIDFRKSQKKNLKYRISDNYTRFYLHYIAPEKQRIEAGIFSFQNLESLPQWSTILGFQFENLVINNVVDVLRVLQIPFETVNSFGPLTQTATKQREACQVDLVVSTKHSIYIAELKLRQKIEAVVIKEVEEKIRKLKLPIEKSIRPILIYEGELSPAIKREDYFTKILSFQQLLNF